ncbi:response regulator transcription factor [uncultured Cohaesibacter sp.]|uniref:response regulator transcription factor n=1 Tax=uncultured Cohaesibacter sp. TaxID=1002546 RepID=UPI0029302F3E|nr:response regulator transcription factor [uncultured Cohaesibacter sp.]
MRVLLVEDNQTLAEAVVERFRKDGHVIDHESDGNDADYILRHKEFDLILLDINLPGRSGFDILKSVRARDLDTPVLVLSARSEIDDRVIGLEIGADDYLTKPFDFRELLARCRVLARRKSGLAQNVFRAGNFTFDWNSKLASIDGKQVELRNKEVQLLELFLTRLDRVLTKEEIADKIYNFDGPPSLNAIEQTMTRLRKKLDGSPFLIKTIRGLGYIGHMDES